jgi:uncharacterized membrane protein
MQGHERSGFTRRLPHLLTAAILLSMVGLSPAQAHKGHKKAHQQVTAVEQNASPGAQTSSSMQQSPTAEHGAMGEMMDDMDEDRSSMSFAARLFDWLGRLHPIIIHFPIAFFVGALFTAIAGRRREAFTKPVQFLVVAGGLTAPVAAAMGWLDAMNADPDPLLTVHRWLGTAIGAGGLGLAIWALVKPWQDRSLGMLAGLTIITAAVIVQGWFGGALVHGIDHLNW